MVFFLDDWEPAVFFLQEHKRLKQVAKAPDGIVVLHADHNCVVIYHVGDLVWAPDMVCFCVKVRKLCQSERENC